MSGSSHRSASLTLLTLLSALTLLAPLGLFTACEDSPAPQREEEPPPEADQQSAPPDLQPAPDATPAGPPPHLARPRARVYASDPLNDEGRLSEVELPMTRFTDGRLTSEAVEVFNCLNEEGGLGGPVDFGGIEIEVYLCREEQVLRPDPDGNYLSVAPPADQTDPNDSFAELMMYHHVNRVAAYYRDRFGLVLYEDPLPALVNVQFTTKPLLRLPGAGLNPGPDGFIPFDNALFFPKESWEIFAQQFGLPPRDQDLIAFFQGQVDFAYDASVIYHEYTHAVIGIERLQGIVLDRYGVDPSPGGMNEGMADYFAATVLDQPEVGRYGIGSVDPRGGRDLSDASRCGEDTHWEVHEEGRIIGATLWALRERLGAEESDLISYRALESFTTRTTHALAAELFLDEAERLGRREEVEALLRELNFIGCPRVKAWRDWDAATSRSRLPAQVSSAQGIGVPGARALGAPAFKQLTIDAAGAPAVQLRWKVGAGGGGFGGFGGQQSDPQPLNLALRQGERVELRYRDDMIDADAIVEPPLDEDGWQELVIAGDCLPADGELLYSLFLNRTRQDAQLLSLRFDLLDEIPEGAERCAQRAPEPQEDAGVEDAGVEDAGIEDPDLGDAGVSDAGMGDAGAGAD